MVKNIFLKSVSGVSGINGVTPPPPPTSPKKPKEPEEPKMNDSKDVTLESEEIERLESVLANLIPDTGDLSNLSYEQKIIILIAFCDLLKGLKKKEPSKSDEEIVESTVSEYNELAALFSILYNFKTEFEKKRKENSENSEGFIEEFFKFLLGERDKQYERKDGISVKTDNNGELGDFTSWKYLGKDRGNPITNPYLKYSKSSSSESFDINSSVRRNNMRRSIKSSEVVDISLLDYIDENGNCILPNSVTEIEEGAFKGCYELKSIIIPNSVTKIGDEAFSGCKNLKSITIPNSVIGIGEFAFESCYGLTSVTIPDSVTYIGEGAFDDCERLVSINIPNSVPEIYDLVFQECYNLKSIDLPNSITSIGWSAFGHCEHLESITIPDSVTYIGDSAFYGCHRLKSIIIPDSVRKIGKWAFRDCEELESITIPDRLIDEVLIDEVIKYLPNSCLVNGQSKRSYMNNLRKNDMGRFIRNGLSVERIIESLEDEDIEDTSVWAHIDFNINEEDIGIFARTYLELKGHKNPEDIVRVEYDKEFDKAIDWFGDIDAAGADLVTYKDGSTETLAWQYGGDELYKVKWVKPPRYPRIKF